MEELTQTNSCPSSKGAFSVKANMEISVFQR